jgi:hypothetical protein
MSHTTSYHTQINRGRKAGLTTSELYSAMSARTSEGGDPVVGATDGNGFAQNYNKDGKRIYRPVGSYPRP